MTKTESYVLGMKAINNFYNMLYAAMLKGMKDVRLSQNGAYVWRGYRIDWFNALAPGKYSCQVYPFDPDTFENQQGVTNAFSCRELVFQENYKEPSHKTVDDREEKHAIKSGSYYYPFQLSLNLYRSRFFLFEKDEQFSILQNFVEYASRQALIWQQSNARNSVTSPEAMKEKKLSHKAGKLKPFEKVDIAFLDVWGMQTRLFSKLEKLLWENAPKIIGMEIAWLCPNASIHNFDFRGYRLKFDGLFPGDRFDYLWAIYFEDPRFESLGCFSSEKKLIHSYNLKNHGFFDLSDEQQDGEMLNFIQQSLTKV